jgi:hypothetical protein
MLTESWRRVPYQVESSTLGTFLLFLVPGWTYASGTVYTATFNRLP